jgi:anti-anti-sigma factor
MNGLAEALQLPARCEALEIVAEQHLHVDPGVRARLPHLPPLPVPQVALHHGALDVEVEVRKIEVGRERLANGPVFVLLEHERVRLVEPRDPVLVEDARELLLDGVRETWLGGVLPTTMGAGAAHGRSFPRHAALTNTRADKHPALTKTPGAAYPAGSMSGYHLDIREDQGGRLHLALRGELDLTNARTFEAQLEPAISRDEPIVLDLNGVSFLDSAALHVLFKVARRRAERQTVVVVDPAAPIAGTLRIVDFERAAPVVPSLEAAATAVTV